MVNFSKLNPQAEVRVKNVLRYKAELEKVGIDLLLGDLLDEKESRDRFFAATAILLPYVWAYIHPELQRNRPEIDFRNGDFHKFFIENYMKVLTQAEHDYSRQVYERIQVKISGNPGLEVWDLNLTQEERAFINFVMLDPEKKPGLSVLSSRDALFIFAHVAEVVGFFCGKDIQAYIKNLDSKEVKIFMKSLMINDPKAFLIVAILLKKNDSPSDHKNTDYHFDPKKFSFVDGNLQTPIVVMNAIRRTYKENCVQTERRNCPASYVPETVNNIFNWLREELVFQYKSFLEQK